MDEKNRFKANYTNTLEDSKRMIHRLENFMIEHALSFSLINKILMCVDEIVTNIVMHAYKDRKEHTVYLESRVENGKIFIEFRDDGVRFNPTEQKNPDTSLSIENRDIGGLGLLLVKRLMDKMEYEREGDYNVLKITKKID